MGKLLLGCLFFGSPLGNDAIVLRGALHAIANLFASWIISHKGTMVPFEAAGGKESLRNGKAELIPRQAGDDGLE
jgi:hypothetical protein